MTINQLSLGPTAVAGVNMARMLAGLKVGTAGVNMARVLADMKVDTAGVNMARVLADMKVGTVGVNMARMLADMSASTGIGNMLSDQLAAANLSRTLIRTSVALIAFSQVTCEQVRRVPEGPACPVDMEAVSLLPPTSQAEPSAGHTVGATAPLHQEAPRHSDGVALATLFVTVAALLVNLGMWLDPDVGKQLPDVGRQLEEWARVVLTLIVHLLPPEGVGSLFYGDL
jgi:hypothetical protein